MVLVKFNIVLTKHKIALKKSNILEYAWSEIKNYNAICGGC